MQRNAAPDADRLRHDAQALHAAVSRLVRVYQFRDRDRICCHDVSVSQCHALERLVEAGPQRLQALAAAMRLDKSTASRVVDALVRKGYVERRADPDDGRAQQLRITRSGRALHDRIDAGLVDQQAELLADLDPALRAEVARVVDRLARAAEVRFAAGVAVGECAPADPHSPARCG
jgi:MarR family transcriptional regulator, 2-MHQ and catechol-resistance regulon repressor